MASKNLRHTNKTQKALRSIRNAFYAPNKPPMQTQVTNPSSNVLQKATQLKDVIEKTSIIGDFSKENEKMVKTFLSKENLKTGVIVEFKFENYLYVPYRLRTDKNKANGEITIKNTMINIEEAISVLNLIQQSSPDLNINKLSLN